MARVVDGYTVGDALLRKAPMLLEYPLRLRRFSRGQAIVRFQEPLEELLFLAEGRARVFRVMENGRAILHTLFQGFEVIGDLELLQGYPTAATDVQAVTDVIMLAISLEPCRERLLGDAAMLRLLGGQLAGKLERCSRQAAENLLYPLSARLAAYMLFSAQEGFFSESLIQVSERMAVSYRHLLRTLKDFCQRGVIGRAPGGYRILDAKRLAREGASLLREDAADGRAQATDCILREKKV